ncbi:MAG: hypothetical protein AB7F38_00205 [Piscinibacter sp.]
MSQIRHTEQSRDSLYEDLSSALERVVALWHGGERQLRFAVPVLCALRLEAFVNVAGKVTIADWDRKERSLKFLSKCEAICSARKLTFDRTAEPNHTALRIFELRHELVHPKMVTGSVDELISEAEYERRNAALLGLEHPLRAELSPEKVDSLVAATQSFFENWSKPWLGENPEYWLRWGSTGGFSWPPNAG